MRRSIFNHAVHKRKCNVCVIGGGPAGVAAALRAVDYDKTVCLVDRARIGGADVWGGALQSKTLWEMSKLTRQLRGKAGFRCFGITAEDVPPPDCPRIRNHLAKAAETRENQISQQLVAAGVDVLLGEAKFNDPYRVVVSPSEFATKNELLKYNEQTIVGNGDTYEVDADYFVIATGSNPRAHPQVPFDNKAVLSSDTLMAQDFPKSAVIIGAGVIGCEFASILANFGETQVNLIEKRKRILPMEDEDVALFIQDLLVRTGKVKVHHESALEDIKVAEDGNSVNYSIKCSTTNQVENFTVDRALVSIGRIPNTNGLDIEKAGVVLDPRGAIKVNTFHQCETTTNLKHIYACGDITGGIQLVNVGELEGRSSVDHMYSCKPEDDYKVDTRNLSTILFLDQEVAAVGLNEQDCRAKNIAYKTARYSYKFVGRAVAMSNTRGFVKLIVTNDRKMEVLGVRAVGPHASSVVELASLAINQRASAFKLSELHTAYPAITQGFQECLLMLLGRSNLKPNTFPELVLTEWKPPSWERGRAYAEEKSDIPKL